jgi:hypothetical protein
VILKLQISVSLLLQIPTIGNTSDQAASYFAITNLGIPFTGSMSAGFTIGFMKG